MSGWGHGTVHMELSRGQGRGRLAASRVRLLAALLHSSKESNTTVSWDRRQQEVSDAVSGAGELGIGGRGCKSLPWDAWGKGYKGGCSHGAQDLQNQSFPRARQEHLHNSAGVKGGKHL